MSNVRSEEEQFFSTVRLGILSVVLVLVSLFSILSIRDKASLQERQAEFEAARLAAETP